MIFKYAYTINSEVVGHTINHCLVHLIHRRKDDVESPIGGVRIIIGGRFIGENVPPISEQSMPLVSD